jgi:hypothetical protein
LAPNELFWCFCKLIDLSGKWVGITKEILNVVRNIMLCSSRHPLLAAELVIAEEPGREEEVRAVSLPLHQLEPGPWRSLGGYLNYTRWPERERFAELDLAIKVRQEGLSKFNPKNSNRLAQRCRATASDREHSNSIIPAGEQPYSSQCEKHRTKTGGAALSQSAHYFQGALLTRYTSQYSAPPAFCGLDLGK